VSITYRFPSEAIPEEFPEVRALLENFCVTMQDIFEGRVVSLGDFVIVQDANWHYLIEPGCNSSVRLHASPKHDDTVAGYFIPGIFAVLGGLQMLHPLQAKEIGQYLVWLKWAHQKWRRDQSVAYLKREAEDLGFDLVPQKQPGCDVSETGP
jgi:hypothetical protein